MSTLKAPATSSFRRFGVRNTESERFCIVVETAHAANLLGNSVTAIPKSDGTLSSSVFPIAADAETITHKRDGSRVLTKSGAEGVAIVLGLPAGARQRRPRNGAVTTSTVAPVAPAPAAPAPDVLGQVANALGAIMERLTALESAPAPAAAAPVTSAPAKSGKAGALLK